MRDKAYRKIINSWAMYDWANSAFATTIMAAMFPPFYRRMAMASGLDAASATAAWAYTLTVALVIIAVLGPFLGALSDYTGRRKRGIVIFAAIGIFGTSMMAFLNEQNYIAASVTFILGNIGFAGSNVFYESLLPHISRDGDMDRVSTRGYACGYLGAGLLLIMNLAWVMYPEKFFMPSEGFALRASFLSVAVWWALFTIPILKNVPEPDVERRALSVKALTESFKRLIRTFKHIREYKQLLLFLVAFWIYSDGISTIIKMATAYGDEVNIGVTDMVAALVITQFVGIPATLLFGRAARTVGAKRMILAGLSVYTVVSIGGVFMSETFHFYILAAVVGLTQGGTQALSRSIYGSMVPKSRSSEFFGFMAASSKFAGIFGPLVFGTAAKLAGSGRMGIASLVLFFVGGIILLSFVDVDEGKRVAREAG